MKRLLFCLVALVFVTGCQRVGAPTRLTVMFSQPTDWNGHAIPGDQICARHGGTPATPPLVVRNIPPGATHIIVEFNDTSYVPLSYDGGLGKIGFYHDGTETAWLLPVSSGTMEMPEYAFIEAPHRAKIASNSAYLAPCSGGQGHQYAASVKAVRRLGAFDHKTSQVLGFGRINLGRY